jgi:metal-responsive CopG/Arc/MetJ family transcriptional regulator
LLSIRPGQGDTKRLDRFAVDRGVSRSEVVREALDRYRAEFDSYLEESPKDS